MTTKQKVTDLMDRLPDDCSWEQFEYQLHVKRILEKAIAEADNPSTEWIPHE